MLSTSQVAELVGVTPTRIRQQARAREQASLVETPLVEYLQTIPEPAGTIGNSSGYNEYEIIRWRAYREGGQITRRDELAIVDAGDAYIESTIFEVLRYPDERDFRTWLHAEILREVTA